MADEPANGRGNPKRTDRRRTLGLLVGAGSVAYAGALAAPGYAHLTGNNTTAPSGSAESNWTRVVQLEALAPGKPERVRVIGESRDAFTLTSGQTKGSVWLLRTEGKVKALSAECPHLGCSIDLSADKKNFGCPCHTSRFGLDGVSQDGPSPRAMDRLEVRIVEGWVEIAFRRFKQGVADRVEVG